MGSIGDFVLSPLNVFPEMKVFVAGAAVKTKQNEHNFFVNWIFVKSAITESKAGNTAASFAIPKQLFASFSYK